MYREHFGLQHPPFRITPQADYFYTGAQRGALLEALLFAVTHDEGIIRVSGEVGTGKTMLCRMLIERLPADTLIIYIANPSLSPAELISTIAHELGVAKEDGHSLLRLIERRLISLYAEGQRVIAIIDEAHAMPRESLDQIRLLSNLETSTRKLLQIVLFGQPELDTLLQERPMRSLRERITQSFFLKPLDQQQIRDYLDFRLRTAGYRGPDLFQGRALSRIAQASRGLTRRVNIIADKALLAAFAENTHTIQDKHINAAIRDAQYRLSWPLSRMLLAWLSALTLSALIFLIARPTPSTPNTPSALQEKTYTPEDQPPEPISEPYKQKQSAQKALQGSASETHAHGRSTSTTNSEDSYASIPTQLGPLARERLLASRADMLGIADSRWFIQLRSIPASNAPSLESFLPSANKALDATQLRLFVVKDDPKQTVGVIYGTYPDAQTALSELARLPDWITAAGAFVRPFKSLRTSEKKATADAVASGKNVKTY